MRLPSFERCALVVAPSLMVASLAVAAPESTSGGGQSSRHSTVAGASNVATVSFTDVGAGLTGVRNSSVAWGDYDNDGDLDILLTGLAGAPSITKLYRNSGGPSPTFTDVGAGLANVQSSSVAWGDYDNDGDLDILLTGFGVSGPITKLYRNSGGANPTFVDVGAVLTDVQVSSVAWGDYDNDGDLDILLTGYTGSVRIAKLYRNSGGANPTFSDVGASLDAVNSSSVAWGDYDNDGDLDILLTGFTGTARITKLYQSSGGANPTFTDAGAGLANVQSSSVAWGDYDNDGDLDVLLTGYDTGNIPTSKLYRNDGAAPNTPPNAPGGLTATTNASGTTFSWNAASDAQTPSAGLSYNLRVGTTPGGDEVSSAMAAANGYRRVARLGNAGQRTSWTLAMPPGPYYWSVQALDGAFQGSAFATSTVAVDETQGLPTTFELDLAVPNPFTSEVALSFALPRSGPVKLAVFDLAGRRLRVLEQGNRPAGRHRVAWDGRDEAGARLGNGIYLVRMTAAGNSWTRKLVLAR